jgi:hypothetical protein
MKLAQRYWKAVSNFRPLVLYPVPVAPVAMPGRTPLV